MMNLLSPQAEKTLTREYWVRVISVWAFLLSGACLTLALLLIPTYVLIHTQLSVITKGMSESSEKQKETEERFARAEGSIREANELAAALRAPLMNTAYSDLYEAIAEAGTKSQINLKTFIMRQAVDASTKNVEVQGEARTRTELISFKTEIERSPYFEDAAIPISDLARETDLPFVMTITLSPTNE